MMNKLNKKVNEVSVRVMNKFYNMKDKCFSILSNNKGEGFVDTALKILISVVVGALILAALYFLFDRVVMPTLSDKIRDLFNYKG